MRFLIILLFLNTCKSISISNNYSNFTSNKFNDNSERISIRFDGVYTYLDTALNNDSIPRYKSFTHIGPLLFFSNGCFVGGGTGGVAYSDDLKKYVTELPYSNKKYLGDYGTYEIKDNVVYMYGKFNYMGRGGKLITKTGRYSVIGISNKDTLIKKIIEPYPKIKMKWNKDIEDDIVGKKFFFESYSWKVRLENDTLYLKKLKEFCSKI